MLSTQTRAKILRITKGKSKKKKEESKVYICLLGDVEEVWKKRSLQETQQPRGKREIEGEALKDKKKNPTPL